MAASKLERAKRKAFKGEILLRPSKQRVFEDDLLKHFIRTEYWLPRAKKLTRAREIDNFSYLSLCADTAFDVRLFKKEKLINFQNNSRAPFVFCEYDKDSYATLDKGWKSPSKGFLGKIEEISTNTSNPDYGRFWGTFPFDIINLDFWGDIHKANYSVNNIYYAIQAVIAQQAMLRKPYELWITWRAKGDRVGQNIRKEYELIIGKNNKDHEIFRNLINKNKPNLQDVEVLVHIGFIKWLLYSVNRSFSVIEEPELLSYTRKDKDRNEYHIINFLLRINPYEENTFPSPANAAAEHCLSKYLDGFSLCFEKPIDVNKNFAKINDRKKTKLRKELEEFHSEFEKEKKGFLK